MFDTRLIRLPDQSHTHAHEHHQLVMSLAGRAEFEVNGCGGEVCRMRACLVPGEAGHVFAGVGDNRMLIIDLGEDNPTRKTPTCSRACSRRRATRPWTPTSRTCSATPAPNWPATAATRC